MSFSSTAKDELIRLPLGKACCQLSELSALTQTSGALSMQGRGRVRVTYRVENTALARRIFQLLRTRLGITPKLHFVQHTRLGGQRTSVLTVEEEDAKRLLIALHMMEQAEDGTVTLRRTALRHPMTRQCCRKAFLRGAFLGCGSMTSPEKSYHLEWIAEDQALRQTLGRLLEKCGLPVHEHTRRGQSLLYLKSGQQIADALALMGASHAVLELENTRIKKEMRGAANRASNCDEHNGERQLNAAEKQAEAIRRLMASEAWPSVPDALREIAALRLGHMDLSLTELGQLAKPPVGKSGVNHRLRRLLALAEEMEPSEAQ